jgi:hypothetical protein
MTDASLGNDDPIATHLAPVWRDRANFLIHAKIQHGGHPTLWEQLWARQIAGNRFEICCIPFFTYDVALGDEVETSSEGTYQYVLARVTGPSGHATYRVYLGESPKSFDRRELLDRVERLGCLVEWSSENLVAIDAPPDQIQAVADILWEYERAGNLIYETGRSA